VEENEEGTFCLQRVFTVDREVLEMIAECGCDEHISKLAYSSISHGLLNTGETK
jgi:hypothetical protein